MAESQQVTGHRSQPVGNGGLWTVNGSPIQNMKRQTIKRITIAVLVLLSILAIGYLESVLNLTPNH